MILTTDFHTHILFDMDDGSTSLDESVKMVIQERDQGVKTIVLTPHFYPEQMDPDTFIKKRQIALDALQERLKDVSNCPVLIPGAEVTYFHGMSRWEQLDKLKIGESNYILIEMPFSDWSKSMRTELEAIHRDWGLIPILSHIERYLARTFRSSQLKWLSTLPVCFQVNCNRFVRFRTRNMAIRLLKLRRIHFVGSDCHGSNWRAPNMEKARRIILRRSNKNTIEFLNKMEQSFLREI